jgi:hypothetical protein
MKFKRLVAGGLAAAAALTLGVLLPSEANADVVNGCPSDRFCVWEDTMYSGRLQVYDITEYKIYNVDIGVSSYWNRTKIELCGYTGSKLLRIVPGEQSADMPDGWNDRMIGVFTAFGEGGDRCH